MVVLPRWSVRVGHRQDCKFYKYQMKTLKSKFRQINIPDKCLRCNNSYKQKDIDILQESGDLIVFHLTCTQCKTSVILNMVAGQDGIISIGAMTDASKEDIDKIKQGRTITTDDVIKVHKFFTNDGTRPNSYSKR